MNPKQKATIIKDYRKSHDEYHSQSDSAIWDRIVYESEYLKGYQAALDSEGVKKLVEMYTVAAMDLSYKSPKNSEQHFIALAEWESK